MPFINPIELLGLQHFDIVSIDEDAIKKSRKRLLTEIELSDDGTYNYMGNRLTKSDCELAVEELNNKDKKEYYYQLANGLKPLNDYLVTGADQFFSHFKQESIYRLPDFINFINPFFAENFSRSLLRAFKKNDENLLSSILRAKALIGENNLNMAFKGVSAELQGRIEIVDGIKKKFENKESNYTNVTVKGTLEIVQNKFPIIILNLLPPSFQSQINKIADSINYLQIAIFKNFNNTQTPYDLLVYLLQLNIESVDRPIFEKNLQIIKEKNEERIEQEKNAPVLKKWADISLIIKNNTKDVEGKRLNAKVSATNLEKSVNIDELNGLPSWANEIRDEIGKALRNLSIAAWNSQKDIDAALKLITLSLALHLSRDIEVQLNLDLKDLRDLKKKREEQGTPIKRAPNLSTTNGIGTTIYGQTLYFVFLGIPIIPLSRWNCSPTARGYTFYGKLKLRNWQKAWKITFLIGVFVIFIVGMIQINNSSSSNSDSTGIENPSTPSDSSLSDSNNISPYSSNDSSTDAAAPDYVPVSMENGNISERGEVHSEYDYKINNKLVIKAESTDATVKIINSETDRCVRFVFINSGTTYIVRNIPEGKYYLEIEYGENWEVKEGEPNGKGHFANNDMFKTDTSDYDFNKVYNEDGEISIPSYELTLYTSYTPGNLSDSTQSGLNSNDNY